MVPSATNAVPAADAPASAAVRRSVRGAAGPNRSHVMLTWTLIFLVIALIAGALGFSGVSGAAQGIARVLFLIFLIGLVVSLVLGLVNGFHGGF